MASQQQTRKRTSQPESVAQTWRDRKRLLWLLGLVIPTLVPMSWASAALTGWGVFWWSGPLLMFVIIPLMDYLVGADSDNS